MTCKDAPTSHGHGDSDRHAIPILLGMESLKDCLDCSVQKIILAIMYHINYLVYYIQSRHCNAFLTAKGR